MQHRGRSKSKCLMLPLYIQSFVMVFIYFWYAATNGLAAALTYQSHQVIHTSTVMNDSKLHHLVNHSRLHWLASLDVTNNDATHASGCQILVHLCTAAMICRNSSTYPHGNPLSNYLWLIPEQWLSKQWVPSPWSCKTNVVYGNDTCSRTYAMCQTFQRTFYQLQDFGMKTGSRLPMAKAIICKLQMDQSTCWSQLANTARRDFMLSVAIGTVLLDKPDRLLQYLQSQTMRLNYGTEDLCTYLKPKSESYKSILQNSKTMSLTPNYVTAANVVVLVSNHLSNVFIVRGSQEENREYSLSLVSKSQVICVDPLNPLFMTNVSMPLCSMIATRTTCVSISCLTKRKKLCWLLSRNSFKITEIFCQMESKASILIMVVSTSIQIWMLSVRSCASIAVSPYPTLRRRIHTLSEHGEYCCERCVSQCMLVEPLKTCGPISCHRLLWFTMYAPDMVMTKSPMSWYMAKHLITRHCMLLGARPIIWCLLPNSKASCLKELYRPKQILSEKDVRWSRRELRTPAQRARWRR